MGSRGGAGRPHRGCELAAVSCHLTDRGQPINGHGRRGNGQSILWRNQSSRWMALSLVAFPRADSNSCAVFAAATIEFIGEFNV